MNNIYLEVLFYFYVLCVITQSFYAFYFYLRLALFKESLIENFNEPVSIIICAKDELKNLSKNLESFLNQDYKKYEIVVVDDQSQDGTKFLLKDLKKKYSHLKIVLIEEHVNSRIGKKFALTMGIKSAKYDYVLLSDADCIPASKYWISNMTSLFHKKDIVLGISPFKKRKGLLNRLIRFDEFITMLNYLSFSLSNITYMGVGRNLGYKKSLFFQVKGFASHIHISSGDDDLFIQEVANRDNVAICINKDSDVITDSKENLNDWFYQRKRHRSTFKHYKSKHKFLLSLNPISNLFFWILSILLFILHKDYILITLLFSFKLLLYYFIFYKSMKKLRVLDLLLIYPIMEFFHLFLQLFFVILKPTFKNNSWR